MGTVPEEPEQEPTLADELASIRNRAATGLNVILTGDTQSRLRRPLLFVIVAGCLAFAEPVIFAVIGVVALLLLAYTDRTVE